MAPRRGPACGAHARCTTADVARLHRLPPRTKDGDVRVVVESPRGSRMKIVYEPEHGVMTLGRPLPLGLVFPFDFGFVPGTLAEDGDPLDAMVLGDAPTFPGVVVACRPVAVLQASQRAARKNERARNDRLICVAAADGRSGETRDLADLAPRLREELEVFFSAAVALEGKELAILGWAGARAATAAVDRARRRSR